MTWIIGPVIGGIFMIIVISCICYKRYKASQESGGQGIHTNTTQIHSKNNNGGQGYG